jgi:hypothetical protein
MNTVLLLPEKSAPMEEGLLNVAAVPTPLADGADHDPLPASVPTVQKKPTPVKELSKVVLLRGKGHAAAHAQGRGAGAPGGQKEPAGQGCEEARRSRVEKRSLMRAGKPSQVTRRREASQHLG